MTPLDKLVQFLRIPSVSADPAHAADVRRAAEWVAAELAPLPHVELIEAPGRHPLVYAESVAAPGKPTLLLYGHYDVQPPDPLELWHSPPFEPVIRDNNIYARGACDDKGQTLILLTAVRQLIERDGRLPCNIKILIEGEEESGGEHITSYVPAHTRELAADAALICDTEMFAPGLPALCVGLRGIVYGEIHVQGPAQDLHSGVYGGVAPASVDPSHPLLAKAAAALTEAFGRETVYIRSGGSIPIVGLFQEALGIPSILMGFGLPDDGLHSPNEKFHLPNFHQGIETVEKFLLSL